MIPRVSVVLAVWNGERHLEAAVQSVMAQSFGDFELIVVDDGSTDGTPDILSALRSQDSRAVVVRQENRGLSASLNRGIAMARGAYIARQDGDDLSLPGRFERQVACLDERPLLAAIGTSAAVMDGSGEVFGAVTAPCSAAAVRAGLLTLRVTPVHGSVMMRRSAFEATGGYREAFRLAQDYDLWLRMTSRYDFDNLPDVLYQWRMTEDNARGPKRAMQLKYAGIALVFARERARHGQDSYAQLERHAGNLDAFAADYGGGAAVHAIWGELLLRGLGNSPGVRSHLRRAVLRGHLRPWTIGLFGWAHMGLPWPGGRPLAPPRRQHSVHEGARP